MIMPKNPFGIRPIDYNLIMGIKEKKKKRAKLTASERYYIWDRPKLYGRTCSICQERITKISELELDHTKPYKIGGKRLALAHRDCNRRKGSKSLRAVQIRLGIKPEPRKKRPRKRKNKPKYDIIRLPPPIRIKFPY